MMETSFKRVVYRTVRARTPFVPQFQETMPAVSADSLAIAEALFAEAIASYTDAHCRVACVEPVFRPEEPIASFPVEVWYRLRVSDLSAAAYRAQFESDLRSRNCDMNGWQHFWYNIDGVYSGCYNCQTRRKGKHWQSP